MSGTVSRLSWSRPDQVGGGYDKCTHTIGYVILQEGTIVNHELVKDGWCWWYRKYAPGDAVLERLEKEARDAKKGFLGRSATGASVESRKENFR